MRSKTHAEVLHTPIFDKKRTILVLLLCLFFILLVLAKNKEEELLFAYANEKSHIILDKNGALLARLPNSKEQYMTEGGGSDRVRALTVQKEDRFFYWHLGINPLSVCRELVRALERKPYGGGSTITEQLVKNLLHHENERTVGNKLHELWAATALELFASKKDILTMYLESAYFGNQIEGVEGGALYYYGRPTALLSDGEILRLLVLLSAPGFPPGSAGNTTRARLVGQRLSITEIPDYIAPQKVDRPIKKDPALFDVASLIPRGSPTSPLPLSIDKELTAKIRALLYDRLQLKEFSSVHNAAVVVIQMGKGKDPNTLLSLVGSTDPYGEGDGNQINMALAPRPIGSTWKPFIYSMAIEKGARPYSLITDAEYRYVIGTGYGFYPKNYDGMYRGDVTLHYALANSLNVPAVRALEFDGITNFGEFMSRTMGFIPKQTFDTYQFSVALGGLEMNPLLLAHYFTVFPAGGILKPLKLTGATPLEIPMNTTRGENVRIFAATTTELMNHMLSDRLLGVEQFGLESNLNLPFHNYAVKTGTTYDYHDSWTVGYTPDVVVVAWIGNSDNSAMDLLSGARGAGKLWHDVMTLLYGRGIITNSPFRDDAILGITTEEGLSFGLKDDDSTRARLIMKTNESIIEPHDEDVISFEAGMSVPLRSNTPLTWEVDGVTIGEGTKLFWSPQRKGEHTIVATDNSSGKKVVTTLLIHIVDKQ
jgi:membrane carboxypeptidase/penicillin-binding protein PbpC